MPFRFPSLSALLKIDAATCGMMAAMLVIAAAPISELLRIPSGLLWSAGAILIPFALLFAIAGFQRRPAPALLWLLITGNIAWVVASWAVLAGGDVSPSPAGALLVLVQAGAVTALTIAELAAWRRMPLAQA